MARRQYWNQTNDEGLTLISSALSTDPRLERLARYCALREKGLRRQALAELRAFIEQAQSWDARARRESALRILDIHWRTPQAHQFLTEPLRKQFLERVLEEWRAVEPEDPVPTRHLALLRQDGELLDDALRMDPSDDQVRATIAMLLIRFVDYATHHLYEGLFLGNEADAEAVLAKTTALLNEASDPSSVQHLNREVQDLAALLADWREYRDAPQGSFPDWCRQRNRNHRWWNVFYYNK